MNFEKELKMVDRYKVNFASMFTMMALMLMLGCSGQSDAGLEAQKDLVAKGNQLMTDLSWHQYARLLHPDDLAQFKIELYPAMERLFAGKDSAIIIEKYVHISEIRDSSDVYLFGMIMSEIFTVSPELATTFSAMSHDIVGVVSENDNLVHCLVRTRLLLGERKLDEMIVVTVAEHEGEWKVMMSKSIEGLAMMLKQNLTLRKV